MGHTSICGDLGVDVTSLALVQVDLGLEDIDLLSLHLKLLPEMLLQVLHLLLLGIVVVNEDRLVGGVELTVQLELVLAFLADHVEQICIFLNGFSELTLDLLKLSILFFNITDALLFCLLVLHLLIKHSLGGTRHLKRVQVNQVTKPKHLSLIVFTFPVIAHFFVFIDFFALLRFLGFSFSLFVLQLLNFNVKLALTVNQLQQLISGK